MVLLRTCRVPTCNNGSHSHHMRKKEGLEAIIPRKMSPVATPHAVRKPALERNCCVTLCPTELCPAMMLDDSGNID